MMYLFLCWDQSIRIVKSCGFGKLFSIRTPTPSIIADGLFHYKMKRSTNTANSEYRSEETGRARRCLTNGLVLVC